MKKKQQTRTLPTSVFLLIHKLNKNQNNALFFVVGLTIIIGLVLISIQIDKKVITPQQSIKAKPTNLTTNIIATPSKTPISNIANSWKTYKNTEYNFSFKHPPEFEYLIEDEVFTDGDYKGIMILQNFPRTKFPDYSSRATFQMLISVMKGIDEDVINQNELVRIGNGNQAFIKIVKNQKTFLISFNLNKTTNKYLFEDILSTFNFTN